MYDTKVITETLPNNITVVSKYPTDVPFVTMVMEDNVTARAIYATYTPASTQILRELLSRVHGLSSNVSSLDSLYLITGSDNTVEFTAVEDILNNPSHSAKQSYLKALDLISDNPEFHQPTEY